MVTPEARRRGLRVRNGLWALALVLLFIGGCLVLEQPLTALAFILPGVVSTALATLIDYRVR